MLLSRRNKNEEKENKMKIQEPKLRKMQQLKEKLNKRKLIDKEQPK